MRFFIRSFALALAVLAQTFPAGAAESKWLSLFDGKTLAGWKQLGGKAPFEIREGTIVGRVVPEKQNSFLCTEADFGDFVFECEFKPDAGLNSGVMFRGLSKTDYKEGRVHGYQYEIDPTARGLTAGLYDEARNGWLSPTANSGQPKDDWVKARGDGKWLKIGEWNTLRIECRGSHLQLWLSGKKAVDHRDTQTARGFIGLQVHAPGNDPARLGKEVAFRKLRLQKLD